MLEKIREFDPATQRSLDVINHLILTPTSFAPIIVDAINQNQTLENYLSPEELDSLERGNFIRNI